MENNSVQMYPTLPIWAGMPKLKDWYGINLPENEYLERANECLKKIGMRTVLFTCTQKPDDQNRLEVPCNMYEIESVTTEPILERLDQVRATTVASERYIELGVFLAVKFTDKDYFRKSKYYTPEYFVNYSYQPPYIILTDPDHISGREITILYHGLITDEDNLYMINEWEAEAIAHYCGYVYAFRNAFTGQPNSGAMVQIATMEKDKSIVRARTEGYWNQNVIDQMLDALTSWDRKLYGRQQKLKK